MKRPTVSPLQPLTLLAMLVFALGTEAAAWGQLFGQRTLGEPLQNRQQRAAVTDAGTSEDVGTLEGNERFLRENRARGEFVGSDRRSLRGFVGSEQALGSGRVTAATESLRQTADRSRQLNEPLPELPEEGMYYPRLVLGEGFRQPATDGTVSAARQRTAALQQRLRRHSELPIEVQLRGRRAILRGEVATSEQAELLMLIVSFEPSVDRIENRLRVRSAGLPQQPVED